jgi:hypothetical protein
MLWSNMYLNVKDYFLIQGGGESIEQLCVRVEDAFEQIASENLGKLLSHTLRECSLMLSCWIYLCATGISHSLCQILLGTRLVLSSV